MQLGGFTGRSVVVVGAGGGGIGTSIAAAIAAAGARVVAVDRDAERLELAAQAASGAGELRTELCDASDAKAIGAVMERAAGGTSLLAGLVNVVGGLPLERWRSVLDDDDDNFDALIESNLGIALRSSRAFARCLAASGTGGSVVQIASIAALAGLPFGAGYAAAKAALLSLTRTMALEWGGLGIRVNAVAPGSVRVPRNASDASDEDSERDRRAIPLGRRGRPEDVADAVLFLLSDLSRWITGQVLVVDGGVSVKPSYLDEDGLPVFVRDDALRRRLTGR